MLQNSRAYLHRGADAFIIDAITKTSGKSRPAQVSCKPAHSLAMTFQRQENRKIMSGSISDNTSALFA